VYVCVGAIKEEEEDAYPHEKMCIYVENTSKELKPSPPP